MSNHEQHMSNVTGLDVTAFLDILDDRVEQARDWSPVPAEYQGMGIEDVQEDLDEYYQEMYYAEFL